MILIQVINFSKPMYMFLNNFIWKKYEYLFFYYIQM